MNKNIFITASTGNIGSQIVRNLTALDISFTAGINSKEIESNQAYINFDDEKSLEKAFENTETLFLLFPMHPKMTDWAKNGKTYRSFKWCRSRFEFGLFHASYTRNN